MKLNDTFTIQEMDFNKKDLPPDINAKKLESYWNDEYEQRPNNNNYKIFCD